MPIIQPSESVRWATNNPVDPISLQPAILDPGSTKKDSGFLRLERPPRQDFNFLINLTGQWTDYVKDNFDELVTAANGAVGNMSIWEAIAKITGISSPYEFGAVGDGVADDTAAMAAWAAQAVTSDVTDLFLPPGIFLVNTPASWALLFTNLRGCGARNSVIRLGGAGTLFEIIGTRIQDIGIDCGTGEGIDVATTGSNTTESKIINCVFKGSTGAAIRHDPSATNPLAIENCDFRFFTGDGIIAKANNWEIRVSNCRFKDTKAIRSSGTGSKLITDNQFIGSEVELETGLEGFVAYNNVFSGVVFTATAVENALFQDNVIDFSGGETISADSRVMFRNNRNASLISESSSINLSYNGALVRSSASGQIITTVNGNVTNAINYGTPDNVRISRIYNYTGDSFWDGGATSFRSRGLGDGRIQMVARVIVTPPGSATLPTDMSVNLNFDGGTPDRTYQPNQPLSATNPNYFYIDITEFMYSGNGLAVEVSITGNAPGQNENWTIDSEIMIEGL